ncbi:NUDIX hydrolase [Nocardioides marmotae]|uniref:NUDIX hydrolase n=1 Tax=Nocardioides marmotae TaxID=2663857 RepID=UPI001659883C|nr:NUDIX hydrolase [Nocardioides marmotae]MBC9732625.1 NUDIX hydrolase [Nocardioides marmotae]
MSTPERVLVSHQDAAWLPPLGRADVVLAGMPVVTPSPICLVRLLVTRGTSILVEARSDGRGLDIPTRACGGDAGEELADLLRAAVGSRDHPVRMLGYVRNHVPGAPEDYPWPAPHAYFVVWHCPLPAHLDAPGRWLDATEAEAELGDRHWWPLAAHATSSTAERTGG